MVHKLFISSVLAHNLYCYGKGHSPYCIKKKDHFFYPNALSLEDILRMPLLMSAWVLCSWIKASIPGLIHLFDLEKDYFL